MADISTLIGRAHWLDIPQTRLGIRFTWRSLDQYSNRYFPDASLDYDDPDLNLSGFPKGNEWEIRTYIHFSLGI
jgi:hypothetical protein